MFSYYSNGFGYWFLALWGLFPFILLGWLYLRPHFPLGRQLSRCVGVLCRNQWVAMGTLFLIVLCANMLLACIHYPQPRVHDEFAYQLAADTYASGRLTNPTHPFWQHFETFHVLSQPTRMAKYPPGTGLVLGAGQRLTGHSIFGFWFTLAVGVAALYWALKVWVPSRWAFLGCLLIAINPYWLTNWGQTWWGGAVPFLAGTLLFGSMKRLVDQMADLSVTSGLLYSTVFSIAASMLAISRPFEGLIACVICGIILFRRSVLNWNAVSKKLALLAVPPLLIGAAAVCLIGWNNHVVTGDVTRMPYAVHSARYSASTMWVFGTAPPIPEYRLPRMREFYVEWSRAIHERTRTLRGYFEMAPKKLKPCLDFYPLFGGVCLLPLVFMRRRDDWLRFCILISILIVGIHLLTNFSSVFPHYVAPFACLFYVVVIHGLRCWHIASRWDNVARYVVPAVVCWSLWRFVFLIAFTFSQIGTNTPRANVEQQLSKIEGDHLVFVDYPDGYSVHSEWVYNRADIDGSKIAWAHSLGEDQDKKLIKYFRNQGRQVWRWDAMSDLKRVPLDETRFVR